MVRFKSWATVALLLGLAVPVRVSAASEFKPVFTYPIHKTVLENGLTRPVRAVRLAGDHRVLHGRPHRLAKRGREGPIGLRPFL